MPQGTGVGRLQLLLYSGTVQRLHMPVSGKRLWGDGCSPAELNVHVDPGCKARDDRHGVAHILLLVLKELLRLALQATGRARPKGVW